MEEAEQSVTQWAGPNISVLDLDQQFAQVASGFVSWTILLRTQIRYDGT